MTPRDVVRALLFDQEHRLVLLHWRDPTSGREFLEPPGGRREEGETDVEAVRREVAEETGLTDIVVEGFLATIEHRFTFAGKDHDCRENYLLCRIDVESITEARLDAVEEAGIMGIRRVSVDELDQFPVEVLEPPQLRELLDLADQFRG